jgi:hypothetical protein
MHAIPVLQTRNEQAVPIAVEDGFQKMYEDEVVL